jgi:hypothetical protein
MKVGGIMRVVFLWAITVVLAGCSGSSATSTQPTPPAQQPVGAENYFLVSGWVSDSAGRMLPGATVKVLSGMSAGLTTVADDQGRFSVEPRLEQNVQIRASKEGYVDDLRVVGDRADFVHATQRIDFALKSPGTTVDLKGHHHITFTADEMCTQLPESVRRRSYSADISATVNLYGATFGRASSSGYLWRTLYLAQFGDYARYWLQDPPIWELLPNDAYVVLWGEAYGTVASNVSTLTFAGKFTYCPRMAAGEVPTCAVPEVTCQSSKHQMTTRRAY